MWEQPRDFKKQKKFTISKNYFEYANIDSVNDIIQIIKDKKSNYNELICKNDSVKPYFDIESTIEFNIQEIIDTIKNVFYDLCEIRLSQNDIYILECNRIVKNEFKWSYHVIIDKYHFDNVINAKRFAENIHKIHSEVDLSVYSNGYQNIRMLNCVKKGENIPFKLLDKEYSDSDNYTDEIFGKCLITNISQNSIALDFSDYEINEYENTCNSINYQEIETVIPLIEKDLGTQVKDTGEGKDYWSVNYDHKFKCLFGNQHSQLGHFIKKIGECFYVYCYSKSCKGFKKRYIINNKMDIIKPISNKSLVKLNKLIGTKNIEKWQTIETENGFKSTPLECKICLANPGCIHDTYDHSYLFSDKEGKQVVKSCMTCAPVVINDKKKCKEIMNCLNIIIETQENNTYQELLENLLNICSENEYMREENTGIVYQKVKNYAYTRYLEPNKFLNKIFLDEKLFKSNINNMDNMIKFMKSYNDRKFPFLEYNNDYLGFNNGVFNIITCRFYNDIPDIDKEKGGFIVRKYFDKNFDSNNFETPLMDKVLDYQFSSEVRDFIYACLGRMFNIRDNFGFMLYLLGEASTGKSLIIDVISECFENVGCINDGFETTFGLSSLYKKDIIVTDDLPKHISKIFPQQLFQSCVTNGNVSISVKNGSAINMIWKIPMLWAGNFQVSYIDQGQISRRLLIANFEKLVNNPDTSLKSEIINNELPAFINKCLNYYKKMLDNSNNKTIWQICPEYFLDQQEELKMERNPLYKFLMENTRYKQGEMLTLQEVKEGFVNWLGKNVNKLDNGTFNQVDNNYIIQTKMLCKSCLKDTGSGCCDQYNNKKRTCKKVVYNMEFI